MVVSLKWQSSCQGKMNQVDVRVKGTKWLSGQKGPSGCQDKKNQMVARVKGTKWLSG